MKKLLFSSIILLLFATSIAIFQLSCQRTASAQILSGINPLGKTLIAKFIQPPIPISDSTSITFPPSNTTGYYEFYLINNDGTNLTKINITLPQGLGPSTNAVLSPDGKKIFFQVINTNGQPGLSIYSCFIDGSGLAKLVDGYNLQGTY